MEVPEEVEVLLEGMDEKDISSILSKWQELDSVKKKLAELDDMLRAKIKAHLKERQWDRYVDKDTKISVSISKIKRQSLDKSQLKLMLTDAQLAQVYNTTTYEKVSIITPEARERLKKYARKDKK